MNRAHCFFCGRPATRRWQLVTDTDSVGTRFTHCEHPDDCWRYAVRRAQWSNLGKVLFLAFVAVFFSALFAWLLS